ncbi:MAG: hypothetical protein QY318_02740 [Candidatus Dojkabacteria bacterium]|nr:MAG: hypothetical protein QY318_02740 [Candidatus Dojkabacteria bacterium]
MNKKKLYVIIGIIALSLGIAAVSFWFVNSKAPDVVNVTNVTSSSATISWVSDEAEPGKVIVKRGNYPFPFQPRNAEHAGIFR